MAAYTFTILLLCMPSLVFASHHPRDSLLSSRLWRRGTPAEGYYNPLTNGGSLLTKVNGTFPEGQGEPINVILSANSDSDVLKDTETNGGLRNYFLSFGFSSECLGQHSGSDQQANLGDGNDYKIETAVIRWNYDDPSLGACKETIQGGNHFRYWVQDGKSANSGAVFMALSYEKPIAQQHDIIDNGYNLARDWLVGNATGKQQVDTTTVTNASTYSGQTSYGGYTYHTNVQYASGLLDNSSIGINHNITVGAGGINAVDGLVAILGVTIAQRPDNSNAAWNNSPPGTWRLSVLLLLLTILLPLALS